MKRLIIIFISLFLALGLCGASFAQQSAPLTSMDFTIMGVGLNASPEYQAVPKGIASRVDTVWTSGGSALPVEVVQQLPSGFVVKAELTGPAYQSPLYLTTVPGQPFDLPTLPLLGKYTLSNIRIFDSTGTQLFGASPQAVTIESIKDPLITQVTTRQLTLAELQERGVTFDSSNYTAYEFTASIATESGQVPVKFPVLIPDSSSLQPETEQMLNPDISVVLPAVNNLPPEASLDENISLSGFSLEVDKSQFGGASGVLNLPPIPGVVMIPGNIGFLHQYFSALVVVTNGAPGASNLIVKNLTAEIILPPGGDGALDTNDDPLAMAKVNNVSLPKAMPVLHPGPDGKFGTGDDISLLHPAESGQADFTIEGIKEGTHKLDFKITAVLEGLPIGPVNLIGHATGAVLVRNPDFSITLGHPATVRSGEEYDFFVTLTNTSKTTANNVSVYLSRLALSGADFAPGEGQEKQIKAILPGSSGTVKYRLVSQKTGKVTATAFQSEDLFGRFTLRMGVGELGIPLSPDSLIIPYTGSLAPDLVEAAVGLLGQAWSVATAPAGALPADVLPIAKQTITLRANDLSEAGLRILMGDQGIKAVHDLAFDFLGSDNANRGFDDLRRRSTQGQNLNTAFAALFQTEVAASDIFTFQGNFADQATYRPGHISVITNEAPVRVQVSDASNNRIGGLASGEAFREIPYGDQLVLSAECGVQSAECTTWSTLSLITKLESTSYRVDLKAEADALFDLGIVVPDAAGTLRQVRFAAVQLPAGARAWVTLQPGTTASYALSIDTNGDGAADSTVPAATTIVIPDHGPSVVAATQLSPGFGPGGDKHGRNVAVLFSERVTKETAQNLATYSVEENAVRSVYLQPSGRMAILLLRDGIGPFFGDYGADGKFYGRKITIGGVTDPMGNGMSPSSATLPVWITATGPAAVVSGTVRKASGEPVTVATIKLYQLVWFDDGFELTTKFALYSEKPVNPDGTYRFEYVFQNDDPTGPFMIEAVNPATNEAASIQASVLHHGQQLGIDLFMKARGSVTGTVKNASGAAVPNAGVMITTLADSRAYVATTDGEGRFSFTNVRVGAFSLKAVHQASASQGTIMGILPDDGGSVTQDVTIYKVADMQKGSISGAVLEADGITPRTGATVIVSAPYYQNWTITDGEGKYLFSGVYAGNTGQPALVSVSSKDTVTNEESKATGYLADGQTLVLNLIMKGTGSVTGEVRREDGGAVSGLSVMANGNKLTTTDAAGSFTFQNVPVGNVDVKAIDPNNYNATIAAGTVTLLSAGDVQNIVLFVPKNAVARGAIQGTVYKRDGSIYPAVDIYFVDFKAETVAKAATSNADGTYSIPNLPLGTYYLVAKKGADIANGSAGLWYGTQDRSLDLRMSGIGTVTGTIYDAGSGGEPKGAPTGADVSLVPMYPDRLGWLRPGGDPEAPVRITVKSDPQSGRYTFTGIYAGQFTVSASNVFRPTPVGGSGTITANGQAVTVDLVLKDTYGSISGQVLLPDGTPAKVGARPDGSPLSGTIKAIISRGNYEITITADDEGRFETPQAVPAGSYSLTAVEETTTLTARKYVSVPAGGTVPVTIRLLGRGGVTVRATYANGNAATGASVSVAGGDFPNDGASGDIITDDGAISFNNLSEGKYAISVQGSFGRNGRAEAVIPNDGAHVTMDVTLSETGAVAGRFLQADGVTPVRNGGQIALLNAYNQVLAYAYASTDPAHLGEFSIQYVPLGDFKLEGYDSVSERKGVGGGRVIAEAPPVTADVITIPRGAVRGTVLTNSGAAQVGNASVAISVSGAQYWSYSAVTTPDGTFQFAGVPAGTFTLNVSDPATGLSGSGSGKLTYEGETVETEIGLQPSGSIEGTVYIPRYDPITKVISTVPAGNNANVSIWSGNFSATVQVDGDGRYRFTNLPTGRTYSISATEIGTLRAARTSVALSFEGQVATADITLNGLGTVNGRVFLSDGNILEGAVVKIYAKGAATAEYTTTSGPDGSYSFTNKIPAGTFTVQARHPNPTWPTAASASGMLTLEGEERTMNLVLGEVGTVKGTVYMADGTKAAGGGVRLTGCSMSFVATIDNEGGFLFENIPLCASFTVYMEDALGLGIGYVYGGLTSGETWDVGAVYLDDKAISVTEVTPMSGSVNVPVNTQVVVYFSEAANPGTIKYENVYLMQGSTKINASVSPGDAESRSAVITLQEGTSLNSMTLYTVVVTTNVTDRVYRQMAQAFTSTFTTIDNISPAVTAVSPIHNAIQVAQNGVVRVTFSESIDPAALAGIQLFRNGAAVDAQLDLTQGNTVAILTPWPGQLSLNAAYTVSVSGVKDQVGNVMTGTFISAFNTIDTVAPTVLSLTIPDTAQLIRGNSIQVTAVSDVDTAFVDFIANGGLAFTDNAGPFVYTMPLSSTGPVTVKAVAQDKAGNRNSNDPWAKELSFTVNENQPPTVAITAPTNNGQVSTGQQFSVTVQATDDLALAEYTLTATGVITSTQKQTCSDKNCSSNFWLPVPQNAAPGSTLTLTAVARDSVGNVSGQATITLTVRDDTAPMVTSLTSLGQTVRYKPGDSGASTVIATDNIGVTSVTCTATGAGAGSGTFTVDPPSTSATQEFTFQVSPSAAPHASITLSCSAKDAALNTSITKTLTLYVADTVPPVVASTDVPGGPDNVQARPTISITFNEALLSGTVDTTSMLLTVDDGSNTMMPGNVLLTNNNTVISFTPTQDLVKATAYKLTITTAVTDTAGNALAGDYHLTFATDNTPPSVTTITPENGAQNVPIQTGVVVRFSEAIKPETMTLDRFVVSSPMGTVAGALTFSVNNTIVTFAPSSMAFLTDYTVTIKPGVEDVMGNVTTTDFVSTFRTGTYDDQHRVVYYDTKYPVAWISRAEALIYKNFLVANGFTAMNADELKTFIQTNGAGSVVVMAQDVVPDTVADVQSSSAIIRKYLDAGGTVVWMQDVPIHYQGHPNNTWTTWSGAGGLNVLGISWSSTSCAGADISRNGALLGITTRWTSCRSISASQVTKVFAYNGSNAAAWLKNYNPAYPDTGFIRLWDEGSDYTTRAYLEDLITILGLNKGDVKYPDLVAQYHMDNDWLDASGNGYNGTQVNNPGFDSTNKFAGTHAGNFNGVNQYVNIGNLYGSFPDNAYSIEAWVQPDNTGGGGRKTIAGAPSSWSDYLIGFYKNQLVVSVGNGSTDGLYFAYSGFTPKTDGTWYHVVGTYDGSRLKLYVDGQLKDDIPAVWKQANNSGMQFWIGGEVCCSTGYFDGRIDDLAIYRRALSADDILEHYSAGISDDHMPPFPPSVNEIPSPTDNNLITLSGKKDSDASVRVNGTQIAGIDGSTDWSAPYTLELGENVLHFTSRDAAGNESPEITKTVELAPANGQDSDIIGLWHFDGNWKDFSGNSNHGYAYNGAALISTAKVGTYAASFDGVNDYVQMMMDVPESNFSIELWAKTDTGGGLLSVNAGSFSGSSGHDRHIYVSNNGNACFRVYKGSTWCSAAKVNDNAWHHWMFVTETGVGQKFYLDGVLVGTNAYDHSDFTTQDRLTLGYSADKGYFKGLLDEVRILKRALHADEVRARFNATDSTDTPPASPWVSSVPFTTSNNVILLEGTKEADTAVWINNREVSPNNGLTSWQATYTLDMGVNTLAIYARNAAGQLSEPTIVTIEVLQAKQMDSDLVALWHFDGTWSDYSGNNNHLAPYSPNIDGPVFTSDAKVGSNAASFDGVNDYAEVAMPNSTLIIGTQSWAISAWIKTSYTGTAVMSILSSDPSVSPLYHLYLDESGFATLLIRSDNNKLVRVADDRDIRDGGWHHLAGILDRGNRVMRIYVDGQERDVISAAEIVALSSVGSKVVAGSAKSGSSYVYAFKGLIDETAIYKRALRPEEVQELFNFGQTSDRTPPAKPTVNTDSASTTLSTIRIYGNKDAGTSIRINNVQVVAADQYDTWQASYSLPQLGDNVLTVTSRDEAGNQSEAVLVTVTLLAANQGDSTVVGLWHLDGSGTDYSGNGNHVALKNTAAFSVDSITGSNSVSLNGIDDYLEKTSPSSVLNIGNQSWTVSAWIKTVAQNTDSMMIVERFECGWNSCSTSADGNTKAWYKLSLDTGGKAAFYIRSDDNISTTASDAQDLRDGKWHYIVGELDRSAGKARIYVDGAMRNEVVSINGTISDGGSPLVIGKHAYNSQSGGTPQYFKGLIDEVAIYNSVLTSDVVQDRYESGLASRVRPAAPSVDFIPAQTFDHLVTLSGGKETNTSVWVNGVETVPADSSTAWQRDYALQPGVNMLRITARSNSGVDSDPTTITVEVLAAKQVDQDITALWHFDGSWYDYSGNANHLTPMNYADFTSDAQVGPAAGMFNENSSANRYARRASGTGLPLGSSARTMAAWIKPYSYPDATYNGIVAYGQRACNQGSLLSIKNDGRLSMAFWCNDAYQTTGPSVALNEWNHVALVYAGGNKVRFYLNGRFVQESTLTAGIAPNTVDGPIRIGSTDDPGRTFNGLIDEAIIYKRALTDLEMEKLFSQGAGRVGVWHMDDTWDDSSGNNSHGTGVGGASFETNARVGTPATIFDGVDDYVLGTASNLPAGNTPRTLSAWVKVDTGSSDRVVLEYGAGSGAGVSGDFHLYIDGGNLAAVGTGTGSNTVHGTKRLDDGRWHYVVGVYEGSDTNTARIYVDGVLESSGEIAVPETMGGNFSIGSFLGGGGHFNGLMDEVVVFNRALTAAEVSRQYNRDMGRVAYWRLDNGGADSSGSGNDLTAMNGLSFNADSKVGSHAAQFNGSNTYLRRASGNGLPLGNTPRTFMAWIKPYSYPDSTYNGIIAYGQMSCTGKGSLLSIKNDGRLSGAFWCNDFYQTMGPTVQLNAWNHVALTYEGDKSVKFYINGQFVQESSLSAGAPANTLDGPVRIGSTDDPSRIFNGLIDEAEIYSRALTMGDIRDRYNAMLGSTQPPSTPDVNPVASTTYDNTVSLSGTKQSGTSVWINGSEVVPSDDSTSWYTTYSFPPGTTTIYVSTRDNSGSLSEPTPVTVTVQPGNQQDQDLVGLWHMDGNWNDYSGNGNNANPVNNATFRADAKTGTGAASFDGISDGAYASDSLNILAPLSLTAEAWFKFDGKFDNCASVMVFYKGNYNTYPNMAYSVEILKSNGKIYGRSDTAGFPSMVSLASVSYNEWHHVALAIDNIKKEASLFLDGVLQGTQKITGVVKQTNEPLAIGKYYYDDCSDFSGLIDEVAIYKRALSAEEIERSYHAGLSRVGVWHMDDNWNDSSTSLAHGTANGAPAFVASSRAGSTAASLDGLDDYVSGDASKLPGGFAPRAISAWVKIENGGRKQSILNYGAATQGDFALYIDDMNKAALTSGTDVVAGTTSIVDGKWHFVVGAYEGPSTNVVKVYVDGALDGMGVITTPGTVAGDYTIGRLPDGSGYFAGMMDEVIMYSTAISLEDVNKYYNKDLGRVAYWKMENNWEDSSGNKNDLTSGSAGYSTADVKVGAAAGSFNGSNQYVANSSPSGLNLTTNFTIMGWINPKAVQSTGIIDRAQESAATWEIWYQTNQSVSYSHNWNRSQGVEAVLTPAGSVPLNKWTHFTVVYSNKIATLYLSGLEAASKVFNNDPVVSGTEWIELGVNRPGGDEYFNGFLDEFAIYSRALTPEEVREIFNLQNGGTLPPDAPTVNPVPASSYDNTVSLSGAKQPGTSIWINGVEVVPADDSTSWYTTYSLPSGTTAIYVSTRDSFGAVSDPTPVTVNVLLGNQQDPDLVGLWHMDGNWQDYSGSGNHGTSQNGASFSSNAKIGSQAASFDGVDDYVNMGNIHPGDSFAVEAWVYDASSGSGDRMIVGRSNSYFLWINGGNLRGEFHNGTSWAGQVSYTGFSRDYGNVWTHVAITKDQSAGTFKLYINGNLISTATDSNTVYNPGTITGIGSAPGWSRYFKGLVDDVAIYKRALTAEEIGRHYNAGVGRVGVWHMENNWNDASLSAANGTAYGEPAFVDGVRTGSMAAGLDGFDDYVTGDAAKLPAGYAPRAVSAWIKISDSTQKRVILDYGSASGSGTAGSFGLYIDEFNRAVVGIADSTDAVIGTSSLADGSWHFILGVYEGPSTNVARIYVDGRLENTGTITTLGTVAEVYSIGRSIDGIGYFNGQIDELVVYNRAITMDGLSLVINKQGTSSAPITIAGGIYGNITITDSTVIFADAIAAPIVSISNSAVTYTGTLYIDTFTLASNSTLTHQSTGLIGMSSLDVTAKSISIDSTSKIDVSGRGYLGGWQGGNNTMTGRTHPNTTSGGSTRANGASYGGTGGYGESGGSVNSLYGDPSDPSEVGSGAGGSDYSDWYYYKIPGGNGGGLVWIKANTLTVNGSIVADGGNGGCFYVCAGGGSGGGIKLEVGTLTGRGTISAKGGGVAMWYGGAGGGGRIAVYYDTLELLTSNITAAGGISGNGGTPSRNGGVGTVRIQLR